MTDISGRKVTFEYSDKGLLTTLTDGTGSAQPKVFRFTYDMEQGNKNAYGGTFSYEEVRDRFAPFPNIKVIKGRVPEVLAQDCPEAISFIHMDLNNTIAEIQALDALYDRLTPGGVIVFDDYGWAVAHRQKAAEDQWFAARGLKILQLPTGQGLFIKP